MDGLNSITFNNTYYHLNRDMEEWCLQHVGKGGWIKHTDDLWNINSMFGNTTFEFKYEKHYTWFVLRWS
jgi:hypothetical protein